VGRWQRVAEQLGRAKGSCDPGDLVIDDGNRGDELSSTTSTDPAKDFVKFPDTVK
jgi:hypothetical protein